MFDLNRRERGWFGRALCVIFLAVHTGAGNFTVDDGNCGGDDHDYD